MSFERLHSSCVAITPELVDRFADMESSPTEREIDPKRVKHLDKKRAEGLLVTFHWASAKLGNKELRMNGNHSSTMLAGLNGNLPDGLMAHVDEYRVDDKKDLASLFRQFDDRKSSRTSADVAGAYQGLWEEVKGVSRYPAKMAVDGVAFYERHVIGSPVPSGDDVYEWFGRESLFGFINWVGQLLSMKTPELRKSPIVAAMYATWIANEKECKTFWNAVARGGDEYDESAPTTVLDAYYESCKKKEFKVMPKPAEYCQAALHAWNAHLQQKQIRNVRTDMTKGWVTPLTS